MTLEQNKTLVRRFYKAFEADDEGALREVLAPDLAAYSHGAPEPQGLDAHVAGVRMWNAAFSDTRFTIHEQIAEGDVVATLVTMRSVHGRGEFQGAAPSGREATSTAVSIERIEDGRIAERRVVSDWLAMLHELGLVPTAAGG